MLGENIFDLAVRAGVGKKRELGLLERTNERTHRMSFRAFAKPTLQEIVSWNGQERRAARRTHPGIRSVKSVPHSRARSTNISRSIPSSSLNRTGSNTFIPSLFRFFDSPTSVFSTSSRPFPVRRVVIWRRRGAP